MTDLAWTSINATGTITTSTASLLSFASRCRYAIVINTSGQMAYFKINDAVSPLVSSTNYDFSIAAGADPYTINVDISTLGVYVAAASGIKATGWYWVGSTEYCTVEDVEAMMGQHFSESTRPSFQQVTDAIEFISADLDGLAMVAGYTLPLSSASTLRLLKRYAIFGVSASAWHTGVVGNDVPARVAYWQKAYDDFVTRITSGTQGLPGAEMTWTTEAIED
jgi:hypothetical protein